MFAVILVFVLRESVNYSVNPSILNFLINYKFIKVQPFIRFVDVSATTAAFIRMTVHRQVLTR